MSKFDASIIITTIGRRHLLRAVRSVFAQKYIGRIQVVVGFDVDFNNRSQILYDTLIAECPSNITITWINIGYSTSIRHGGVHTSFYGGSLRSAMSLLANSEFLIYLDDDDWLLDTHVESMLKVIEDNAWAYCYSYYADGNTSTPLCVDELESVGVNAGIYAERFGGFVRPSGLTLNKLQTMHLLHLWSIAMTPQGDGEDRQVFEHLRKLPFGFSQSATVCASIDPLDGHHEIRKEFLKSRGVNYSTSSKLDTSRNNCI